MKRRLRWDWRLGAWYEEYSDTIWLWAAGAWEQWKVDPELYPELFDSLAFKGVHG